MKYEVTSKILEDPQPVQELPYFIYTPWNWRNHWSYYLLYGMTSFAGHTSAMGTLSNDLLLYALISQIIMHFDFVAKSMKGYKIKGRVDKFTIGEVENRKSDMEVVKYFIEYHSKLLSLSERLNDIFGLLLFVHFASASVVICLVGFLMTIGTSFLSLFKLLIFLLTMLIESALICYSGQALMDASLNVSTAVFTSDWLRSDVKCQKMLILMSKRAQRPAQLKATTFIWISQETMAVLIQMSYKFFTLLRTMYVKK
ncbi:odorant receptor 85b-like [Musca vetustissima]|uniref:odorant receptor 85b-like n=1 Tax=Musca vetustissima TaxID=27455 RepID=UPI002AB76E87|nr:odorant receptor 85b-like [Musca vetustissima]